MPTPNDFSHFQFTNPQQDDYKQRSAEGQGKEHGQVPNQLDHEIPNDTYPNIWGYGEHQDGQGVSSKDGSFEAHASETLATESNFADLQQHLMNSLQTPGTRVAHDAREVWTPPHGEGSK